MIRQLIKASTEEANGASVKSKFTSCPWFEDDDDGSDIESDGEPVVATMRKRLLSQTSEATLDTLGMTESSWDWFDEEKSVVRPCVVFSDAIQIFEIESLNADYREELFYTTEEIQRFREEYDQEVFESGSFTL